MNAVDDTGAVPAPYLHPALVVIVNNRRDWQRVVEEGWYRIPLSRAPHPIAADYLAFYHTRNVGGACWSVSFYAPVLRCRIVSRRELLPDEPLHPRADERYYRIELGEVRALAQPIRSRALRRITFIPTTLERLYVAEDVADLWLTQDEAALLWLYFRDAALKATRRLALEERRAGYAARVSA